MAEPIYSIGQTVYFTNEATGLMVKTTVEKIKQVVTTDIDSEGSTTTETINYYFVDNSIKPMRESFLFATRGAAESNYKKNVPE